MAVLNSVANREELVDSLSDDELQILAGSFATNWSSSTRINDKKVDEDGFVAIDSDNLSNFSNLQKMCWEKFNENPQINSHVRDVMGSLTGWGFEVSSDVEEIQEVLTEISDDYRNELHKFMTKFAARSEIEGELFLSASPHADGFIEIDFMEPSALSGKGDKGSGIYFHPRKATMPIFYDFKLKMPNNLEKNVLVPSIYVAYNPKLAEETIEANKIDRSLFSYVHTVNKKYAKIGGFKSFIISWDKGFLTKRNVSHIKTTLKWLNYYVQLKEWEIDHKKSSGSYLWVAEMTDMKAFRTWLKMTDEQKESTGLTAKKVPGGTIILPYGIKLSCVNPQLTSISEQDTDIMHMVTSGLNKPEDMVTGQTKGDTFSGIKASRGPQADRMKDELAYWERFLRHDFWKSVFFLRSVMDPEFKTEYKLKKVVEFKNKKPITKPVTIQAHKLIEFSFPQSEIVDVEAKARAFLGVNHQSVCETLGIPKSIVAGKLGLTGYKNLRYAYQEEEDTLPELPLTAAVASSAAEKGQAFKTGNSNQGNTVDNKNQQDPNKQKPVEPTNQQKPVEPVEPVKPKKKPVVKE